MSLFLYELFPVAPSMFYNDGTMRYQQKTFLMQFIIDKAKVVEDQHGDHHLLWPKLGGLWLQY